MAASKKAGVYGLFDFMNDFGKKQGNLLRKDPLAEKDYVPFMISRFLSYHLDAIMWVNELNAIPNVPKQMHYDYLYGALPKGFRKVSKWSKPEKDEDIALIKDVYKYNNTRAKEALALMNDEQLQELRDRFNKGGKQ